VELSSLMKVFRKLNSQLAWERDANGVLQGCVLEEGAEKGSWFPPPPGCGRSK
jgi:hypothetical protein